MAIIAKIDQAMTARISSMPNDNPAMAKPFILFLRPRPPKIMASIADTMPSTNRIGVKVVRASAKEIIPTSAAAKDMMGKMGSSSVRPYRLYCGLL